MGRGIQGCIKLLPEQNCRTLTSISESIPVSSTAPKRLLSHSGCSEMARHRPETPSNGLELSSFEGQCHETHGPSATHYIFSFSPFFPSLAINSVFLRKTTIPSFPPSVARRCVHPLFRSVLRHRQRIMNPTVLQDSGAFRSPNSSVIGHYGPPQEPWYEQFGYTSYPIGVYPIPRIVWASVDRMGNWEMNNFADVLNAEEYGRPTNYLSGGVGWEWDGRDDQCPGKDSDSPYI
jgi:hypothetical protein